MGAGATDGRAFGLADAFREFRQRRGLSKRALSQRAGLSESYVGKLEAGSMEPTVRSFALIALALELTSHEVLFCVRCAVVEARLDAEEGGKNPFTYLTSPEFVAALE